MHKPQVNDRWNDEETEKLLDYLEENFDKFRQGKKTEFYTLVSRDVIKSKTMESIKGRLNRLLEKYDKVKQQNNQSGSGRIDWKWMEKMDRIFGCRENISPSYVSNQETGYISDETNEAEKIEQDHTKKIVETLIDVINSISETKVKISEEKLALEREKINNEFKIQMEKLELEKKIKVK